MPKTAQPPAQPLPADHPARQWRPMSEAWQAFRAAHPELGIGISPTAQSRFLSRHRRALLAAGAIHRASNAQWFAHADVFDAAAFAALLGLPLPGVEAATPERVSPRRKASARNTAVAA